MATALLAAGCVGSALAAPVLPAPGTVIDGVPVSAQFDDAYSYPIDVLNTLQPAAGWDTSAGTGTLDVIITTRSSGQTNPGSIPDPITNANTATLSGVWGTGPNPGDNLLVTDLRNYLLTNFGGTIPVFTFDQNETGANPSINVTARVDIVDPVSGILHTWSFDAITQPGDGTFDAGAFVTAPGEICIDPNSGPAQCFDQNRGSGHFDYIVFVPTMDLTPWADADNLFRVSWNFANADDGGEEITLTGRFAQITQVPEPASLMLVALGLVSLAGIGRLRRR